MTRSEPIGDQVHTGTEEWMNGWDAWFPTWGRPVGGVDDAVSGADERRSRDVAAWPPAWCRSRCVGAVVAVPAAGVRHQGSEGRRGLVHERGPQRGAEEHRLLELDRLRR